MKSEIVDIARTKAAVSRPSPMEIDAIYKGKGKNKGGKGDKAKGKGGKGKDKGKENSVPHDPNIVCYYCSGRGHRKIDCRKGWRTWGRPSAGADLYTRWKTQSLQRW